MTKTTDEELGVKEIKVSDVDLTDLLKSLRLQPRLKPSKYIRTIPLKWATKAMALPGKSAALAMIIWYLSGLSKLKTVVISRTLLKRFGVNYFSGRRAIKWLEEAGLVRVVHNGNHSPKVTVINFHD